MDRGKIQDLDKGVEEKWRGEDPEDMFCAYVCRKARRRRYLMNFLVAMFGMGVCLSGNGINAELPLLVITAPEGSTLPSNLAIAFMIAFIGPAIYALFKRSATPFKKRNEFIWTSVVLVFGTICMVLMGLFHHVTMSINGSDHSTVMQMFSFIMGLVSASRNVLLLPYLRHFDDINLTSFFIGEGLSGFIPSTVALIQGVGGDPVCAIDAGNTTDQPALDIPQPRFSSRDYFLFVAALMATSTCSFWLLEYLRVPAGEKLSHERDSIEARNLAKKLLDPENAKIIREVETTFIVSEPTSTNPPVTQRESGNIGYRIYLCLMMWLCCLMAHGYLNSVEAYSARPYGNTVYHLTANLSQLAGTLACGLAFWLPPISIRGISGIVGLSIIATAYVTWLGMSAPTPLWRDETYGVILVVTIWVIVISLISYAKLAVTAAIWRENSDVGVYEVGFANLIGTICSASLIFYLVNYTAIFTPYTGCELQE